MQDDLYHVLAGAALGAILGAVAGLIYTRHVVQRRRATEGAEVQNAPLDHSRMIRLGWSVIGVLRQVLELA